MPSYYVDDNAQSNGDHEVRHTQFPYYPKIKSKTYLGNFPNCHGAVRKAKTIYKQSNGCATCSSSCHTS